MNIYIGNMSFNTTEDQLRQAFRAFGEVATVKVIMDRESGQSKGFGFIEMPTQSEATGAINGLNGREMDGRTLNVNPAKPREESSNRSDTGYRRSY